MITRDEVYFNYIRSYIDYNRDNKLNFSLYVQLPGDLTESGIDKLPPEAFQNGLLFVTFDFGAEETWVVDQILLEDGLFKCVLVFNVGEEWKEFPIEFPVINIALLTRNDFFSGKIKQTYNKSFEEKVQNSMKHLKFKRINK